MQLNQKWLVINRNQHPRLLDGILKGNGEGTVFKGTTDVVVVEKAAEDLSESATTCRRLRPVAVLTDSVNMWKFFYFNGSTVCPHTFPSRREAVGYLDAFLKGDIEPEDDSHDTFALRSLGESSSRVVKRSFTGRPKF